MLKAPKHYEQSTNQVKNLSATASAFATYSLVPYLGILFCPGAVVVGTIGVVRSYRSDQTDRTDGGRFVCYVSTIVGVVVLILQLLLWWIMYRVPSWAAAL